MEQIRCMINADYSLLFSENAIGKFPKAALTSLMRVTYITIINESIQQRR